MKNFKLVIEARAQNEDGGGPDFAAIEINQTFIDRLIQLSGICESNGLESVSVSAGPDQWDQQDELMVRCNSFIVGDGIFWFQAYSKQAMIEVETQAMPIDELVRIAQESYRMSVRTAGIFNDNFRWQDGVLYFGNMPEILVDQFLSCDEREATEGVDQ